MTTSLDHETDMWDAIAAQDTARFCEPDPELVERCHIHGSVWPTDATECNATVVRTARTRRGERVVLLTRADIDRTSDTGLVLTTDGDTVVWYTLGRPFRRGSELVAYGYLRHDRAVVAERDRRRSQAAWNASR